MKSAIFLVLLAVAYAAAEERKLFNGDKVYRVTPTKLEHLEWLKERLHSGDAAFDFWKDPTVLNAAVDVHVAKSALENFEKDLEKMQMEHKVNVDDLQKLINKVDAVSHRRRRDNRANIVGKFARYSEIIAWLTELCGKYSKIATCDVVGKTFEKRDIRYVKLSTGPAADGKEKRIIFIEANIHAREWLSSATAIYLLNRITSTYESDPTAKRMLDTYDFIFVPLINADGYEYSQTTDRMWRKTRSRRTGVRCVGVDPNRNYDMSWGETGSSNSPCTEIYRGPSPFSEAETKAMSEFLKPLKDRILGFFTLHTYSQYWLVPYGDKEGHYCPGYDELLRVANIGTKAIMMDVNKKTWQAGNTVALLGEASGGGDDWAKMIGIKYSYTLELRPGGNAYNGFVVAETEIEPSGREIWAGITAAVDAMKP